MGKFSPTKHTSPATRHGQVFSHQAYFCYKTWASLLPPSILLLLQDMGKSPTKHTSPATRHLPPSLLLLQDMGKSSPTKHTSPATRHGQVFSHQAYFCYKTWASLLPPSILLLQDMGKFSPTKHTSPATRHGQVFSHQIYFCYKTWASLLPPSILLLLQDMGKSSPTKHTSATRHGEGSSPTKHTSTATRSLLPLSILLLYFFYCYNFYYYLDENNGADIIWYIPLLNSSFSGFSTRWEVFSHQVCLYCYNFYWYYLDENKGADIIWYIPRLNLSVSGFSTRWGGPAGAWHWKKSSPTLLLQLLPMLPCWLLWCWYHMIHTPLNSSFSRLSTKWGAQLVPDMGKKSSDTISKGEICTQQSAKMLIRQN